MKYMKDLLDSLDELLPVPTSQSTDYTEDTSIKACIFDIYGTLLISSSGDIDLSDVSDDYLKRAFQESGVIINENIGNEGLCTQVLEYFETCIQNSHARSKSNGIPYPEVDILSIWEEVINHFIEKELISLKDNFDIRRMTSVFEILSNKVYPMPGMKEIITYLKDKKIPLGIISNAQFYTPVIMNYFLNDIISDKEFIDQFDDKLSVFSYKEGRAKPDTQLFDKLIPQLNELGIKPKETLFVGNDMLKDAYTASLRNFKTVLFAGDKRSLRIREDSKELKGLKPDYIIDDLRQLEKIIV